MTANLDRLFVAHSSRSLSYARRSRLDSVQIGRHVTHAYFSDSLLLEHQADERKDNNENRDVKQVAMPDPALNGDAIEVAMDRKENEQGHDEITGKGREVDAANIDFLEHGIKWFRGDG